MIETDMPALAANEVRYRGEPILLIAHRSIPGCASRFGRCASRSSRAAVADPAGVLTDCELVSTARTTFQAGGYPQGRIGSVFSRRRTS